MNSIHDKLITVYGADDTANDYNTQGLGALPDFIEAKVTGTLNGGEFFTGTYPQNGVNADKIKNDNILFMFIDEERPRQRMRIYDTNTDIIDGMIVISAEPIFSDIRRYVGHKFDTGGETTAQQAFNTVKAKLKPTLPTRFMFNSTVSTSAKVEIEKFNMLEFFGGKEGSILDRFKGEFQRDNNTLYHKPRIGEDHKMAVIYSKNLNGLELELDSSNIVVGIFPYITGDNDEEDILLPEQIILTDYASQYPNGIIEFVDFKDKSTDVATLRTQAKQWLTANSTRTKPVVSGKIEMIPLKHMEGYEQFVQLNTVSLGDGVDVYHPELEDTISARIVEYEYNVLTDSYDKLTIGQLKSNFLENTENRVSDLINDAIDNLKNGGEISDLINDIVDHQTDLITGNAGGYVLLDPKDAPSRILIMDMPDKDRARNVLQINQSGIGFSSTGINGQYETAWTLDGGFNANFITAGEIVGITIRGTTLISEGDDYVTTINNGKITWFSTKANKDIMTLEARDYISANAGIVSYTMNTGGGFMIRNPQGNLVFSTWDNGGNNPYLALGARSFTFNNDDYVTAGDGKSLSLKGTAGVSWDMAVAGQHLQLDNTGWVTAPNVRVSKNLQVSGSKNSTVPTENYGQRLLNAYETPEYYFADYGEAVTDETGKIRVEIDPIFAETVNLSRYMTHVTPTQLCLCAVTHEDSDHFIIETSEPNILVRWNIIAHRKGYEHIRLKQDEGFDKTYADQKHF